MLMVVLICGVAAVAWRKHYRQAEGGKVQDDNGSTVGRSASTMRLLPDHEGAGKSGRAAAAAALLDDCDDDEEEDLDTGPTRRDLATLSQEQMDVDAIYGMRLAEENGPSPRYDLPHDLEDDMEDEIGPDDSISVAWFKTHQPHCAPHSAHAAGQIVSRAVPVTIEAPDGSRHAMDVELDGLQSTAELRRGMLEGYRDLLGEQLPAHALRVHARLASGSSVLLLDVTPLTQAILDAVSFYVWTARDAAARGDANEPAAVDQRPGVPSIAQRKDFLARQSGGRVG